jgi:hypothetical protein
MPRGPLLWDREEFDVPRQRGPRWLLWLIGAVGVLMAVIVIAGLLGGVGPLRILGLTTQDITVISYRPTVNPNVIQVGVALPPQGLCRGDDIAVTALEQSNRVELRAQAARSRLSNCERTGVAGSRAWVDVSLRFPLAERAVIRMPDRLPLSRES